MIPLSNLSKSFSRNVQIIKMQCQDLSHKDSLMQLPFRGNCMNWVVGHILTNRQNVLKLLGSEMPFDTAPLAPYQRESEPILEDSSNVLRLDELIRMLERSQEKLNLAIAESSPEAMQQQIAFFGNRKDSVTEWLMFFYFHETYHTGQTEILRQLAGKDDKVI